MATFAPATMTTQYRGRAVTFGIAENQDASRREAAAAQLLHLEMEASMAQNNSGKSCCNECGSDYLSDRSPMASLCPECAHWLYGYPPCAHEFVNGRCSQCGWDGAVSAYVLELRRKRPGG